jgi:TOTE conflict system, Archaeo-Eukaryotic Primase domain
MTKHTINTKIRLFCRYFTGLRSVYGTYDFATGRVWQVKKWVDDEVIGAHIQGIAPYGVYLLKGSRIKSLAVDFDDGDLDGPRAFVEQARQYDLPVYVERSKSKGYHIWFFFQKGGVLARKARAVAQLLLSETGKPGTEIFPKQDFLDTRVSFGNFINAPLFGKLVPKDRTVFIDPSNQYEPYEDQWQFLKSVQRINERQLEMVIARGSDNPRKNNMPPTQTPSNNASPKTSGFALPPCAQKMLADGVSAYQRVNCFRLACHLRRCGLTYDDSVLLLKNWAPRNRPDNGNGIITVKEIEAQTRCAFTRRYRSFGCEDPGMNEYCNSQCPLNRRK